MGHKIRKNNSHPQNALNLLKESELHGERSKHEIIYVCMYVTYIKSKKNRRRYMFYLLHPPHVTQKLKLLFLISKMIDCSLIFEALHKDNHTALRFSYTLTHTLP